MQGRQREVAAGRNTEEHIYKDLEISRHGNLGYVQMVMQRADSLHPPPQPQTPARARPATPVQAPKASDPVKAPSPKSRAPAPATATAKGPGKGFDPYRELGWTRMPLGLVNQVPRPLDRAILCEIAEALGRDGRTNCRMTWAELGRRCGTAGGQIKRRVDGLVADGHVRVAEAEGPGLLFELCFDELVLDRPTWGEWAENGDTTFIPLFHGLGEFSSELKPLDRQVLGLIAFRTRRGTRRTSLAQSTIAKALGLSRTSKKTVADSVARLRRLGLIELHGQDHRRRGQSYTLGDLSRIPAGRSG